MLRGLAADTPGVELLPGWTATELRGGERPAGVTIESADGGSRRDRRPPDRRRRRPRLDAGAARRRAGAGQAEPPLLLLGLLERPRAGGPARADVAARAGLRLHLPQRGRADGGPGRAPRAAAAGEFRGRSRGRLHADDPLAARRPRVSPARPASRSCSASSSCRTRSVPPPGPASPSSAMPPWPATRSGGSAAAGRSRAPSGSSRRPRRRWSVRATSTPPSTATGGSTSAGSRSHHMQMSDFASGRPSNLFERMMWRAAADDPAVLRKVEKVASRRALAGIASHPGQRPAGSSAPRGARARLARFDSIGSPEKGGGPNLSHMLQGTLEVQGR